MDTVVGILGLLAATALLWTGLRRLRLATPISALLSVLDLLALGIVLWALGIVGLVVFVGANAAAFLAWGAANAIKVDADLAHAASQAPAATKEDMERVQAALVREPDLLVMGARRIAIMIRCLGDRARTPDEIEAMGRPVGLLWIINRPDIEWLVASFDTLMRIYDHPAREAMKLADTLTASVQRSAANFEETVEALVVAGGGTPTPRPSRLNG